jgi:archaellum component FlaF (FlaF/FlaG flagellin family)
MGTLIFVGILFTSVIPMYMVMRQADNVYAQKKLEITRADDDRGREDLWVFAYPDDVEDDQIYVNVANKGTVPVDIVRVWVYDYNFTVSESAIASGNETQFGPYIVGLTNDTSCFVTVTTERGNVFNSISGDLYYSDGTWYTPSLGVVVNIGNDQGKYRIHIHSGTLTGPHVTGNDPDYESTSTEWNDVTKWFEVTSEGSYVVEVWKKKTGDTWVPLPGTPLTVTLVWPGGNPIVFAYVEGTGV